MCAAVRSCFFKWLCDEFAMCAYLAQPVATAICKQNHDHSAMCGSTAMNVEDDFRIRPGRIRSSKAQRARPFIAQALAATQRAGGTISRLGKIGRGRSRLGKGQRATIQANRLITSRSRGAVVKARVVRNGGRGSPLATHLTYLRREGVTRDGEKAQLFGPDSDRIDVKDFAVRCQGDRHHFRFIVSPDDATEMSDLKSFTRDLVAQMQKDLDTKLDWAGVAHWNTEHPHIHLIVRGVRDDGENLVIARDYIKEGMRDRARNLITQELGPRTEQDIRRELERQIASDRWTKLDRQLLRDMTSDGIIDLAPLPSRQPDAFHALKVGRLRKLAALGLADEVGAGQWTIPDKAEATLRALGERGDIIKRIHRGLSSNGIERNIASYVLASESLGDPVIGRLVDRGLDDELKGIAYAVVDGVDGRTHHIRLPDLDAASDGAAGSLVEVRKFEDARGNTRAALAVRSEIPIEQQILASGATWLDRQAVARMPIPLGSGGFGAEVRDALERRAAFLVREGLGEHHSHGIRFKPGLLESLQRRELDALGKRLAEETGLGFVPSKLGDPVAGTYRQRFALASGRFAMISDGLGFQLVPWSPSLEKHLGQQVSGIARDSGGIDWIFARKRGLGL
jgi:type IV secretory pathway VirD2 relaxase